MDYFHLTRFISEGAKKRMKKKVKRTSKLKMQNHGLFSSNKIYFCGCQKADEKKSKEDEQTLEELII